MHLVLVDLRESELDGQQAEDRLHDDRHHGQPQRGAVRPAPADGHQRPARRHAGARDARPAGRRLPRGRRRSSPTALTPDFDGAPRRAGRARRRAIAERYPLYAHLGTRRRRLTRPRRPRRACRRRGTCDAFAGAMNELDALYAFLVALAVAALLTPLVARFATRIGAVDHPRDRGLSAARHAAARRPGDLRRRAARRACCSCPVDEPDAGDPRRRGADHRSSARSTTASTCRRWSSSPARSRRR